VPHAAWRIFSHRAFRHAVNYQKAIDLLIVIGELHVAEASQDRAGARSRIGNSEVVCSIDPA
jgi:hypothetical protein